MTLHTAALLTAKESRTADSAAIKAGATGVMLMERAGRAVADVVCETYSPCPTLILCGNGNNGGDGFVVARILSERKWPVTVALANEDGKLAADAALARQAWEHAGHTTYVYDPAMLESMQLVIDGLFGTGLARAIKGPEKKLIESLGDSALPIVAIDIASGIDATTGEIKGVAVKAAHTVSFVRPKLGHVLLPGKDYTGQLHVFDIGVSGEGITPDIMLNIPALWREHFPFPTSDSHKYTRGHSLIMGGPLASTGATKLAALGALRSGAGLVSVACTPDTTPAYALTLTAVMTKPCEDDAALSALVEDKKITAFCIGPGYGTGDKTRTRVEQLLKLKKPCVIDADALTAFADAPKTFFKLLHKDCVLTPHEGEFKRLFTHEGSRIERAQAAAKEAGCTVILKGNDTVIASQDGQIAINAEAPAWLATAGTGDVLAGIISGLLAQSMPSFEAACAGIWLHSRAATHFGPGLIAEDLPAHIASAIKDLY